MRRRPRPRRHRGGAGSRRAQLGVPRGPRKRGLALGWWTNRTRIRVVPHQGVQDLTIAVTCVRSTRVQRWSSRAWRRLYCGRTCARPPHRSVHSRRPDIDRARQSLSSACAPVSCFPPPSSFLPRRVERARDLRASLAPCVAAAFTATIVRLPAFPAARPMTCHACRDVSLYVCESCAAGASTDEPRRKAAAGRCWTSCSMRRSRRSQLEEQRERRERASHGLRMPARLAWLCS